MKKRYYICAADLHIRNNRPQFRRDDYFLAVIKKFRQIIKLANKYDAILLLAGDIFDSSKVGHKVANTVVRLMKKLETECYIVAGQHDQVNHITDIKDSPLWQLGELPNVNILYHGIIYSNANNLYGCSFGEIPHKIKKTKSSILVIHKSITEGKPPFFLDDAISAKKALKKYSGYQYIVSGDYHTPFVYKFGKRIVINCGAMMRQNIDQVDHKPRVYLLDTKLNKVKTIHLKVEDSEKVFALDLIKKVSDSAFSEELNELVKSLKDKDERPNFFHTVRHIISDKSINEKVKVKVNELLGEYEWMT